MAVVPRLIVTANEIIKGHSTNRPSCSLSFNSAGCEPGLISIRSVDRWKTGNAAESKQHFEQFTREAAGVSAPARKHLIHVHTRLMELAGQSDDAFGENLHRGIGLVLLVKQWRESPEPSDAALNERTLVQAARSLKLADADRPDDARVWFYLAEAWAELIADGRRKGRPRNPIDMMIAATAIANSLTVVTLNERDFEGVVAHLNPLRV